MIFANDKKIIESFISKFPMYIEWENDSLLDEMEFKNEDWLTLEEKVYIYIYAWSQKDIAVSKKKIMQFFDIKTNELNKIIKELKYDDCFKTVTTFNQNTGLISGKGYFIEI